MHSVSVCADNGVGDCVGDFFTVSTDVDACGCKQWLYKTQYTASALDVDSGGSSLAFSRGSALHQYCTWPFLSDALPNEQSCPFELFRCLKKKV